MRSRAVPRDGHRDFDEQKARSDSLPCAQKVRGGATVAEPFDQFWPSLGGNMRIAVVAPILPTDRTMPVLAQSGGVVIRMLIDRTFGTRFHAFYGGGELVIGINPLRVIQGEVPEWVQTWALQWVKFHQEQRALGPVQARAES